MKSDLQYPLPFIRSINMALHVTQCPSCDSSFNTNARLLLAAEGLVRCGACLSVFEAAENFILPDEIHDAADSEQESVFISGREDFLDVARFIRTTAGLNETLPQDDPADSTPVDSEVVFNEAVQAIFTETPVGEDDVDFVIPEPVFQEPAVAAVSTFTPAPEIGREEVIEEENKEESKEVLRARLRYAGLEESSETLLPLSDQDLASIRHVPDPLELEHRTPQSHWRRNLGYGLLSMVLLLSLTGQFLWQRFELLSLHPDLRPVYQLACDFLGCGLPAQEDLRNMHIENLVVRSHPQNSSALIVSAVLRNTADFQQPFPILRLQFRDQTMQPVAGRDFQPVEYLPTTLRSITNIPVNAPVQFTLELADPGTNAVNYELTFISRHL
ncbi:MAG: zinc-ribbon and DUF3426 domain-containing protein [Pseudohongiellaceae bacterium]